jgi:hypothetical protein
MSLPNYQYDSSSRIPTAEVHEIRTNMTFDPGTLEAADQPMIVQDELPTRSHQTNSTTMSRW